MKNIFLFLLFFFLFGCVSKRDGTFFLVEHQVPVPVELLGCWKLKNGKITDNFLLSFQNNGKITVQKRDFSVIFYRFNGQLYWEIPDSSRWYLCRVISDGTTLEIQRALLYVFYSEYSKGKRKIPSSAKEWEILLRKNPELLFPSGSTERFSRVLKID